MKPIANAKHEAQESPAVEKSEHKTGKEKAEKPYTKRGVTPPRSLRGRR
jgi:hypothetical protein